MYAIIQTGGKQYRVSQGDLVQVELLEPGAEKVTFDQVCLVSNGRDTVVGTPQVEGAQVSGSVVGTGRWPKILVFKKKRRKHYKRTIGHRQYFTAVRIDAIDAAGKVEPLKTEAKAPARKAATTRKAAAAKKTAAKKTATKKSATARKAPAKKAAPKKASAKAPAARKKTAARKTTSKKAAPRKKAAE